MMYLGGHYSAATTFDRGLVLDLYGINSFAEDIEKRMLQLSTNSTNVWQFIYFYLFIFPVISQSFCLSFFYIFQMWLLLLHLFYLYTDFISFKMNEFVFGSSEHFYAGIKPSF